MKPFALRHAPHLLSSLARRINSIAASLAAAVLAVLAPSDAHAQITLNFDGTGAPCEYRDTSPLTTAYTAQGITFAGTGAVLNQCSNFIIGARSGTDFLAYTTGPGFPPVITDVFTFSTPFSSIEMYVANATDFAWRFYLGGTLVGAASVTGIADDVWSPSYYAGPEFDRVEISTRSSALLIDDLQVGETVVTPEPGSLALAGAGLAALLGLARGRPRGRQMRSQVRSIDTP
jgi:hypothetical protein